MAKITFKNGSEYEKKLKKLEQLYASDAPLEKAVAAGAAVVADKIRSNLEALPEVEYRRLEEGQSFHGIPKGQKKDLADSFGLTPIGRDKNGFVNTKAGFEGYGSYPTKAYPQGLPNALLARATESGSSVRQKTPFVEPAVKATRNEAVDAMGKVIDEQVKTIF